MKQTWSYSEFLKNKDIEYASLYCDGRSLDEMCPSHIRTDWNKVNARLKAFYRSCAEAKIDLNENCFFDMVPRHFLIDYAAIKDKICKHVFTNYEKPDNYDYLLDLTKLVTEISNQKLIVDYSALGGLMHQYKTRAFVKKNKDLCPFIKYDHFKTKTGRLSTRRGSFPILTMGKAHRNIISPQNDWFIEFDYNAAELRVMLGLLEKNQPLGDIHEWNSKNVYDGSISREEAKKRIFAWLYNPESTDLLSGRIYDRDSIKQKYWNGQKIKNIFNREIEADDYHALNYIIQSTAADIFLRQMIKVWKALDKRKSHLAFSLHDSLVIDFSEEDKDILLQLRDIFAKNELGNFLVNVSAGKNYGQMEKIKVYNK
jgi:hypothetical protein